MRDYETMRRTRGFSLIELLIVVAIILILAAIAIPRMLQARMSANEASAVSGLRNITNGQVSFKIFHNVYATDLDQLGPSQDNLINRALGSSPYQLNGYQFATTGDATSFEATADPLIPGDSGKRHFCTTTPAVINYSETSCDPASSPVLNQQ